MWKSSKMAPKLRLDLKFFRYSNPLKKFLELFFRVGNSHVCQFNPKQSIDGNFYSRWRSFWLIGDQKSYSKAVFGVFWSLKEFFLTFCSSFFANVFVETFSSEILRFITFYYGKPIFGRISTLLPFFGRFHVIKSDKSKNVWVDVLYKYISKEKRVKK